MNIERRAYIQKLVVLNFNRAGLYRIVVDARILDSVWEKSNDRGIGLFEEYLDGRLLGSTSGREGWLYIPHPLA